MALLLLVPAVRPVRHQMGDQMISYAIALLIMTAIAAIAGLALNMQWGLGGLVNFGLFGFYMLGAYVCGVLSLWQVPPLAAMLAAVVVTAAVSAAVSLISIRLSEDYLAIVTLGFAECLRLFISYEDWLTRGTHGIPGIRRPFDGLVPPAWAMRHSWASPWSRWRGSTWSSNCWPARRSAGRYGRPATIQPWSRPWGNASCPFGSRPSRRAVLHSASPEACTPSTTPISTRHSSARSSRPMPSWRGHRRPGQQCRRAVQRLLGDPAAGRQSIP